MNLLRSLADTLVPPTCVGCQTPGAFWCSRCAKQLDLSIRPAVPGLSLVCAAGRYEGAVIRLIHAWKEDSAAVLDSALAPPLAMSIAAVMITRELHRAVVVPIPSTPAARRRRQGEPLARLTDIACELLRARRVDVELLHALRTTRGRRDQSELDIVQRSANMQHAMTCVQRPSGPVIVVDDIVTSGATLREAHRALGPATPISGYATVAATPRRGPRG